MNCKTARHLIDDYLENQLSRYDRQGLEEHLSSCVRCSEELRRQRDFERTMWRSLAASLQHRTLSSEAGTRIVQEAQGSLERSIRVNRVKGVAGAFGGALAAAFVLIGILWLGRPSLPTQLGAIASLSAERPASPAVRPIPVSPVDPVDEQEATRTLLPAEQLLPLTLRRGEYVIEPRPLVPGEAFTVTVFLQSDLPEPLDAARLDLDIDGPTGYYRFALSARGPLAARGLTALRVTSDSLEGPCEEKYQIPPTDIFGASGIYTVRVALPGPDVATEP